MEILPTLDCVQVVERVVEGEHVAKLVVEPMLEQEVELSYVDFHGKWWQVAFPWAHKGHQGGA